MKFVPTHQDRITGIGVQEIAEFYFEGSKYIVFRASKDSRLETMMLLDWKDRYNAHS